VMCGINDLGALLRHNYAQRIALLPEETFCQPPALGPYYRRLAWLRVLTPDGGLPGILQDQAGLVYRDLRAKRKEMLERKTFTSPPADLPAGLAQYKTDLERLVMLCQKRNQKLLLLTHPSLYQTNMPARLSSLLWEYTDDGAYSPEVMAQMMDQYNSVMKSVCREQHVELIDMAALVPKDTTALYDDVHLNIGGCRQVAEILAEYFKPKLPRGGSQRGPL